MFHNFHIIVRGLRDGKKMFNLNASTLIHQAFMAYPIQREGNILRWSRAWLTPPTRNKISAGIKYLARKRGPMSCVGSSITTLRNPFWSRTPPSRSLSDNFSTPSLLLLLLPVADSRQG